MRTVIMSVHYHHSDNNGHESECKVEQSQFAAGKVTGHVAFWMYNNFTGRAWFSRVEITFITVKQFNLFHLGRGHFHFGKDGVVLSILKKTQPLV